MKSDERYRLLEDGSLIIIRPTEQDIGKYECIAKNRIGDAKIFSNVKQSHSKWVSEWVSKNLLIC